MIAGYIITGGKNTRMNGQKKLFLTYKNKTFGELLLNALQSFPEIYLSVEDDAPYQSLGYPMIVDEISDIGPMGGIYSGLKHIDAQALFVVACDMPFLTKQVVERLINAYNDNPTVVLACDEKRVHPLLGIYPREILPVLEEQIRNKNYRLMDAISKVNYVTINIPQDDLSATNINDVTEYQLFCSKDN